MECPKCKKQLAERTSMTASNPGRKFATCDRRKGGCGYFVWRDGSTPEPEPEPSPEPVPQDSPKRQREALFDVETMNIVCVECAGPGRVKHFTDGKFFVCYQCGKSLPVQAHAAYTQALETKKLRLALYALFTK
jgi:ribosomal protein L37AE/L43A